MKLLVDMNLSPRWVEVLSQAGIEALHWSEVGAADALDADIMRYAHQNGFCVFTHDLDFSAILAASGAIRPSVIQVRHDDVSPEVLSKTLLKAIRQHGQAPTWPGIGAGWTTYGRFGPRTGENFAAGLKEALISAD